MKKDFNPGKVSDCVKNTKTFLGIGIYCGNNLVLAKKDIKLTQKKQRNEEVTREK